MLKEFLDRHRKRRFYRLAREGVVRGRCIFEHAEDAVDDLADTAYGTPFDREEVLRSILTLTPRGEREFTEDEGDTVATVKAVMMSRARLQSLPEFMGW